MKNFKLFLVFASLSTVVMASDLPTEVAADVAAVEVVVASEVAPVVEVTTSEVVLSCSFNKVMDFIKTPVTYVNGKLDEADKAVVTLAKPAADMVSKAVSDLTELIQPATDVVTSTVSDISTFVTTSPVRVVIVAAAAYATYCAYSKYSKSDDKKSKN